MADRHLWLKRSDPRLRNCALEYVSQVVSTRAPLKVRPFARLDSRRRGHRAREPVFSQRDTRKICPYASYVLLNRRHSLVRQHLPVDSLGCISLHTAPGVDGVACRRGASHWCGPRSVCLFVFEPVALPRAALRAQASRARLCPALRPALGWRNLLVGCPDMSLSMSRRDTPGTGSNTWDAGGVFKQAAAEVLRRERRLLSSGAITRCVSAEGPFLELATGS